MLTSEATSEGDQPPINSAVFRQRSLTGQEWRCYATGYMLRLTFLSATVNYFWWAATPLGMVGSVGLRRSNSDGGIVAMARVAALCSGVVTLLSADNCYAAAALNRQLVEVEYLMWGLSDEHEEAASWLRSTKEERLRLWQPRHLRERSGGRFRGAHCGRHCEVGGHSMPMGARLLIGSSPESTEFAANLQLWECAAHVNSTWRYFIAALNSVHINEAVAAWDKERSIPALARAEDDWRARDPMFDCMDRSAARHSEPGLREDERRNPRGRVTSHGRTDVTVEIQGDPDVRVTESLPHDLGVNASLHTGSQQCWFSVEWLGGGVSGRAIRLVLMSAG